MVLDSDARGRTHDNFPALIVGLGGTGVRVLRFLQWTVESNGGDELQAMLSDGRLAFFGVDTEAGSATDAGDVSYSVIPDEQRTGDPKEEAEILPPLHSYYAIERTTIEDTYETLREQIFRSQERSETETTLDLEHQCILEWFPWPRPGEAAAMSVGLTTSEGASQWRPLGRLGFFNAAQYIHSALGGLLQRVNDAAAAIRQPPRVFIISSLAGGTGSGMFWDVAFLLRLISRRAYIRGYFLLPDIFEGVDDAGRIWPNAYAALKEIAFYKNWRQDSNAPIRVRYPLQTTNNVYIAHQGDRPAYNSIFLYKAFLPDIVSKSDTDLSIIERTSSNAKNVIDKTCLEVARNALCHLRVDVHDRLGVGGNNESSDDADSFRDRKEGGYVFCTSAVLEFDTQALRRTQERLQHSALSALHEKVKPDSNKAIGRRESNLVEKFLGELPLPPDVRSALKDRLGEPDPNRLVGWISQVQAVRNELKDRREKDGTGFQVGAAELGAFFERAIPDRIRDQWLTDLLDDKTSAPPRATTYLDELYEVGSLVADELASLAHVRKQYEGDKWRVLHPNDMVRLTALQKLFDDDGKLDERQEVVVQAPVEYQVARAFFGAIGPRERGLEALSKRYGDSGALDYLTSTLESYQTTLESIRSRLAGEQGDLGTIPNTRKDPKSAILDHVMKSRREFLDQIKKIDASAETNRAFRTELVGLIALELVRFPGLGSDAALEGLLEPLPGKIARLQEQSGDNAVEVISGELAEVITRDREYKDLVDVDGRERDEKDFKTHLTGAVARLCRDAGNPAIGGRQAFLTALQEIYPLNTESVSDKDSFTRYLKVAEVVRKHLIEYWLDQQEFFLPRLTGESGGRRLFSGFRTDVFRTGAVENTIRRENLVIMPPESSASLPKSLADRNRRLIAQDLARLAHAELFVTESVSSQSSPRPIMYFESLFRAPQELSSIHRYFHSYIREPKHRWIYFHALPVAVDLPELLTRTEPPRPIRCGNPDCNNNLRGTRRTELICPSCENPIQNRCGNADCTEDALLHRLEDERRLRDLPPTEAIYSCPACDKPIRTHWWQCPEPAHYSKRISTHASSCPACLKDLHEGQRTEEEVEVFGPRRMISCPGCRTIEHDPERVMQYPALIRSYYEGGVSGSEAQAFSSLIKAQDTPAHLCRNGSMEHYLFPTCPEGRDGHMHHLTRLNGAFVCEQHSTLRFAACHACKYPIAITDELLETRQPLKCERCTRSVVACHFCFPANPMLVEPRRDERSGYEVCPHCENPIEPLGAPVLVDQVESALWHTKSPAFCRNMFGCRAGRGPYRAITDYHLDDGVCRACQWEPSPLLAYDELENTVGECPLCLILVGTLENGTVNMKTKQGAAELIRTKIETDQGWGPRLDDYCPLCGTHRGTIYNWMTPEGVSAPELNADGAEGEGAEVPRSETTGSLPSALTFNEFLEIAQNMVRIENDRALYLELRNKELIDDFDRVFTDEVKASLGDLFKHESVCERSFIRRFSQLIVFNDERIERRLSKAG